MAHVAIYNSFPFHYEMFGYIIHYCVTNRFTLTIYTTTSNDMGWMQFYTRFFQKGLEHFQPFFIKPINSFGAEFNQYDLIVLTTDDDPAFKDEWISSKVLKIAHINFERRPQIVNTIYNRPYDVAMPWALPCFPIVNVDEKISHIALKKGNIDIVLIGGYSNYKFEIFNRMARENSQPIVLHFVNRVMHEFYASCRSRLNENISTKCHINTDTNDLFKLIQTADYLCIECSSQPKHYHNTMSGAIPMAFSCLTPLIIDKKINNYYKFQNTIEYDIDGVEPIELFNKDNYNTAVLNMELERDALVSMLTTNIDVIMNKHESLRLKRVLPIEHANTALIVEPRKLDRLPIIIKQYRTILGKSWNIVFYCGKGLKQHWFALLEDNCVEIRELDTNNLNSTQYSDFFKTSNLWKSLTGEYILHFQSDSWIHYDPIYNIDFFIRLNQSYIGGNMSYQWNEFLRENIVTPYRNFNGGLSLRKRGAMISIIEQFPPKPTIIGSMCLETDAEDVYFAMGAHKLGFKIGSDEQCSHFAVHTIFKEGWFGTHSPNHVVKPLLVFQCPEIANIY